MNRGLVSVIIPTYKRSEALTRAIDSVINQTYSNIEIIVVDDNGVGTENQLATEKRLKNYIDSGKITYIKHLVNKNGSAARNTGWKASKGEFINFLDDDDFFFAEKIQRQVKAIDNTNSTIGGAYSPVCYIVKHKDGKYKEVPTFYDKEKNVCVDFLLGKAHFNTSGLLFKRTALEKINGFDETFRRHQDFELMIRFSEHFTLICGSSFPLYYMDKTSTGSHGVNPINRFEFERQFLQKFSLQLKSMNCYKSVCHFMYFQCCESELIAGLYKKCVRSLIYSSFNGILSISEIKSLARLLWKSIK